MLAKALQGICVGVGGSVFKISFIDIAKNLLIVVPWVKQFAVRLHKTGILNDQDMVRERVSELFQIIDESSFSNASVVEFGPGQTCDTIKAVIDDERFDSAAVVDLIDYFSEGFWDNLGIQFCYETSHSLASGSVDFIFSYDVLEHVRDPTEFFSELRRIVDPKGKIFISWDLRDHLHLDQEEDWFDMHKYGKWIWWLQMSNRSSYVNRLLLSDWIELIEASRFRVARLETTESRVASAAFASKYHRSIDSTFRVKALLIPQ